MTHTDAIDIFFVIILIFVFLTQAHGRACIGPSARPHHYFVAIVSRLLERLAREAAVRQ